MRTCQIAETDTATPGTGRPWRSKRRPWITCSGRSLISASGCSASGSSLDPADSMTGRQGDGPEFVVSGRRRAGRSSRNRPDPSAPVRPITTGLTSRDRGVSRAAWFAPRPSPPRSGRACPADRARGRRRTSGPGPASGSHQLGGCEVAVGRSGLVLCQGVSQMRRAGGEGGEEQQGHRGESQLVDQHGSQHLLGKGRRRGRGGLSGRESIAALVVMSHRGDETEPRRAWTPGPRPARRRAGPRRGG